MKLYCTFPPLNIYFVLCQKYIRLLRYFVLNLLPLVEVRCKASLVAQSFNFLKI